MVQFNTKDNEILVKIVFYGAGLSGKTTNLQKLHEMTDASQKTDLFSVNTMEDRTLFFDLLPLDLGFVYGNSIKLQIYTVPGQVHYDSTRRIVLSGADGVVFVADSDENKLKDNVQSMNNLYHNLQANRLNIKEVPLVMQYNKRDLPNVTALDVLNKKLNFRNAPYFEAIAVEGKGVLETFLETVRQTVRYIFTKYQLSKNIKNVDSVIEKLESSIKANAKKVADLRAEAPPKVTEAAASEPQKRTVLKYTHQFDANNEKDSHDQLLKKALTSNMETAQLYTKLKKSQEELKVLYQQLEKSNADNLKIRRFLESMVNYAGEAMASFNEKWVIQNWNQSAEELFGYKRKGILGQNIAVLFPEQTLEDLKKVLEFVMNGKVVRGFETKLKTKNGQILPASITFSPIKNQNNTITNFMALIRDLSPLNRVNRQLNHLQLYEGVIQILPDVVSLIQSRIPIVDPPLVSMLENIKGLADTSVGFKEPTNLNMVIGGLQQLIAPRLAKNNIGWSAQLYPTLPTMSMDRRQITRAYLNLFLNAIETLTDKENGKITVGTHFANGEILTQIIDNGSGMAARELAQDFSPMQDEMINLKGIRLNVSKAVIKANNGFIRIDSNPGKGTKVTIRFPTQ